MSMLVSWEDNMYIFKSDRPLTDEELEARYQLWIESGAECGRIPEAKVNRDALVVAACFCIAGIILVGFCLLFILIDI